jgi:hypothetical protein
MWGLLTLTVVVVVTGCGQPMETLDFGSPGTHRPGVSVSISIPPDALHHPWIYGWPYGNEPGYESHLIQSITRIVVEFTGITVWVQWTFKTEAPHDVCYAFEQDPNVEDVYIMDDTGRRYKPTGYGDAAGQTIRFCNNETASAYYHFDRIDDDATSIVFHNTTTETSIGFQKP